MTEYERYQLMYYNEYGPLSHQQTGNGWQSNTVTVTNGSSNLPDLIVSVPPPNTLPSYVTPMPVAGGWDYGVVADRRERQEQQVAELRALIERLQAKPEPLPPPVVEEPGRRAIDLTL